MFARICNEVFGLFTASHFRIGSFSTPIGGQKTFTFEMGFRPFDLVGMFQECFSCEDFRTFWCATLRLSCCDITRLTEPQTWDVDNLGVRIFAFHENALATMRSVLDTALLFAPLHTKGRTSAAGMRWGSNVKSPAMILLTLFDSEAYLTYIGSNSFWCEPVKSSSLLTFAPPVLVERGRKCQAVTLEILRCGWAWFRMRNESEIHVWVQSFYHSLKNLVRQFTLAWERCCTIGSPAECGLLGKVHGHWDEAAGPVWCWNSLTYWLYYI